MTTVFTYIHFTDDADIVRSDYFSDADIFTEGPAGRHAISLGGARIIATRANLTKLAAAIAASMEQEDAACE